MSPYFAGSSAHAAESGSLSLRAACLLSLPSDLAVASDALAIRIDFPLFGVSRTSFSPPGLPASPGKQKARPGIESRTRLRFFFHTSSVC
jgi:hypothetical protein